MDDIAVGVAAVRAQIHAALLQLDRIVDSPPELSEEEREAVSAAVMVVLRYRGRSLEALLRWLRDVKDGRESWIVARSLPGEPRADAWFVERMPDHLVRKLRH